MKKMNPGMMAMMVKKKPMKMADGGMPMVMKDGKKVPEFAYMANRECQRGIIDGYFSGDGCVNKADGSVNASSISKDLITGISFILYYFGIVGKITTQQAKKNNIGSKNIKRAYVLTIRNGFAQEFARNFTLTEPNKQDRLENITLNKKSSMTNLY
jgi:intein/homing endonuclease